MRSPRVDTWPKTSWVNAVSLAYLTQAFREIPQHPQLKLGRGDWGLDEAFGRELDMIKQTSVDDLETGELWGDSISD
jgi:hypothetical protein